MAKINNFSKLLISLVVPIAVGAMGALFTQPAILSGWYSELIKPALNPPQWIFGPVWTTLYLLMGVALYRVWTSPFSKTIKKGAYFVFAVQLFLNAIWSFLFFGLKNPFYALIDIVLLWIMILGTIIIFYKISRLSAYILLPYLVWVSFAGYLNFSIWILN